MLYGKIVFVLPHLPTLLNSLQTSFFIVTIKSLQVKIGKFYAKLMQKENFKYEYKILLFNIIVDCIFIITIVIEA